MKDLQGNTHAKFRANMWRCIIGSTPILCFGTRASNAFSGNGAVMYSGP